MKTLKKYRAFIKSLAQAIAFTAAILLTTALTIKFGLIANGSTVAFCFIIIVLLSAFFGNLSVALITSLVATLCFDYFYLPPYGTLNIAAFSDWISLAAFLLTSIIISRLTASAAENAAKANVLDSALIHLNEFGAWLMSTPNNQLTLSKLAEEALRAFSLEYCSIHVYGAGKWQHLTGSAASSDISRKLEAQFESHQDHNAGLMEIVDENMLVVQYIRINKGNDPYAVFVVKTNLLPAHAARAIASFIGIRIMEIMKSNKS